MDTPSTRAPAPSASNAENSASGKGPAGKGGFKETLNLPKTAFAMKANLVQSEPATLKRWQTLAPGGLYAATRAARAGRSRFTFHDGPPYANGSIHIGHLMNKCLKDFVVRSRGMMGLDCPFVPGWDCHGLPIEHKVMTDLVEKGKWAKMAGLADDVRRMAVRRECQAYAEKYIKLQAGQMQRLLTLADYEDPYLTMRPAYEGAVLEVLAGLLAKGLVYRALKPVHWSIANQTALAEAELEYEDREDPSVYVDFEAADADAVYRAFGLAEPADADEEEEEDEGEGDGEGGPRSAAPAPGVRPLTRPSLMIWTTTPWTLPANVAIAVNPAFTYVLVWVDGNVTVLAEALAEKVLQRARSEEVVVLARATGDKLVGLRYRHPFLDLAAGEGPAADPRAAEAYRVVAADYVTLEDGTGLVHTAPGHGQEDYLTGLRERLPIYCPVRGDGTYDATAPQWLQGLDVWKANDVVYRRLQDSGHLFFGHRFTHSYPHDWRSKTPTIYRCTEQWFVAADKPEGPSLRALALETTAAGPGGGPGPETVRFVPEWGRNRMRGMLESRPDWCISRQRSWGLPIPALFATGADGTEHVLMTEASVRAVARVVRAKGSDAWFTMPAADLLAEAGYDPATDPAAPAAFAAALRGGAALRKGADILDVWFESGSSWNAVLNERGLGFPAELYLEGSDQHRGWFQLSLLPALGVAGRPPFRTLLTHGFMVDKDGRKMSKSLGNTLEVEDLLKEYGADVARWWVASLAFENDVKVDKSYLDVAGEGYRKVRNTLRFLLSNLHDAGPAELAGKGLEATPPTSLDAWVLGELDRLTATVSAAFADYNFRAAHAALYDFCNDTLSAKYLAAAKDRLYCDAPGSPRRRRTQAVLARLTEGLCRLLAPVIPHTADEAFRSLHRLDEAGGGTGAGAGAAAPATCVHLLEFLPPLGVAPDAAWSAFLAARETAQQAMERAKSELGVDAFLDMGVTLPDPDGALARLDPTDLADMLGASRAAVDPALATPRVADLRSEPKCERSLKRDGTVKPRATHQGAMLCDRCAAALEG